MLWISEEEDSIEKLIKESMASRERVTQQPRVSATKTLVATEETASTRSKKHDACPSKLIERAETCTYLLSFRKMREIFRFQSDFVLNNFDVSWSNFMMAMAMIIVLWIQVDNINQYCNHSQSYRRCMELSLSQDENCLIHLKNDPFYSFFIAFDDRLCEVGRPRPGHLKLLHSVF